MGYAIDCVRDTALAEDYLPPARIRGLPVHDGATATDEAGGTVSLRLVDVAAATDATGGSRRATARLVDGAVARDSSAGSRRHGLVDVAAATDVVAGSTTRPPVRDVAAASDALALPRRRGIALSDRGAATERVRNHLPGAVSDAALATDTVTGLRRHVARLVDTADATDVLGGTGAATGRLVDRAGAAGAVRGRLHALARFVDRCVAHDRSGDRYGGEVWVTNTATGAASYWRGVAAHAVVEWQGKLVLATPQGLFTLTGAGPVDAEITTPRTDFGAQQLKRAAAVYADGVHDGAQVTVSASNAQGTTSSALYSLASHDRGMSRAPVGRGLEGRYWQLSLHFTQPVRLRSMAMDIAANKRRVA